MPCKNKVEQRKSSRKHYLSHLEDMKLRAKNFNTKARKRNQSFLRAYLLEHPCVDCGEKDLVVLDFDHVRGKKINSVTRLAWIPAGLKTLKDEIEKCDVRCANCHRRITHLRRTISED